MGIHEAMLLEGNNSKHTLKIAAKFKAKNGINIVSNYHPYSPDLNIIENFWSFWENRVQARKPQNLKYLRKNAFEEWEKLNLEKWYFESLINSMPNRREIDLRM